MAKDNIKYAISEHGFIQEPAIGKKETIERGIRVPSYERIY
jgi:hypothetical protein